MARVLKPYNGFSGEQRARAGAWLRAQYKSGAVKRATVCDACGQTEGYIGHHAEDYSEPFGSHVHEFALCNWCHSAVHLRSKAPKRWEEYKRLVREGFRLPAGGAQWVVYRWFDDRATVELLAAEAHAAPVLAVLDGIPRPAVGPHQ